MLSMFKNALLFPPKLLFNKEIGFIVIRRLEALSAKLNWLSCHTQKQLSVKKKKNPFKTFQPFKSLALSLSSDVLELMKKTNHPRPSYPHSYHSHPCPVYAEAPLGPVRTSTRGRTRAARGRRAVGAQLGLHRSNRLPWKRIFLESCFRVSQMELTSCWQSDSAVRAHVWKASQWLWAKRRMVRNWTLDSFSWILRRLWINYCQ